MTHHCLVQFKYRSEQTQAMIDAPSDRAEVADAFNGPGGGAGGAGCSSGWTEGTARRSELGASVLSLELRAIHVR